MPGWVPECRATLQEGSITGHRCWRRCRMVNHRVWARLVTLPHLPCPSLHLTTPPTTPCVRTGLPGEVSHAKQALSLGYAFAAINSLNRQKGGPDGDVEGKCFA